MAKVSGIKETCLSVTDLDRSEAFYRELLELPVIEGDARFRALNVADGQLLLLFARGQSSQAMQLPGGAIPPHEASGQSHIAFAIAAEELEAWKARLAEKRVALESTVTWPRGGTSLYFRDPDGHLVELLTPGVWSIY
jgi:catechol 2,3-dioxygenase-like lactoylglutathione lyase family enzyme